MKVVIAIFHGNVCLEEAPEGIRVMVHDYDCDGMEEDRLSKDPDGAKFWEHELVVPDR